MIVRIFRSGISNGESPVNYIMGNSGIESRYVKPELLAGNPQTTIDVINSIQRTHKYISGAIAFRHCENPSREQMDLLIEKFKETFCPKLTGDNFNSLFVLHRDKGNDEIHFVIPTVEMKSGKRMNIHPPGKKNLEFFETFVRVMNHSMGYAQVVPDPLKMGFSDFERKTPEGKQDRKQKGQAHDYLLTAVRSGKIKTRNDLCHCLEQELGITVTRRGSNYMSVILPGAKKAKRLTGELYSENADYASLLNQSKEARTPSFLTPQEYHQEQGRLNEFVRERIEFNIKAFLTPKLMRHRIPRSTFTHTTTIKETQMETPINTLKYRTVKNIQAIRARAAIRPESGISQANNRASHSPTENLTSPSDTMASDNAFDSVKSAVQALGEAQASLAGALAQLANAKTPEQQAKANQAVYEAQDRVRKAQRKLAMAKIRAINTTPKPTTTTRKIL